MKRIIFLLSSIFILNTSVSFADEGMWLLSMLGKNYEEMQQKGFKLTPEDIYSVNKGSIKDAIIGLGNEGRPFRHFCTGEIVSGQGLFLTNHHCGFSMIQTHSTVEHDYLQDGFWALSKDQEMPNQGITASILIRMEDVTNQVLSLLNNNMSEEERDNIIDTVSKQIVNKAIEGSFYNAYVADMFNSNQFFLFVYVIYKDVRLVGAPPSSMGKFGGDTDNWMWPRHTADFSMFRIYTAPDGSPASFSKDNVPLKPKHFLPVSAKGIQEGDFAMIMGFPGSTERFLTSYGLEETMNVANKLRYEIRDVKINILRKEMASSQKIRIQYASKYANCSNYWKYSFEQNKALKNLKTIDVKKQIEADYMQWANGQSNPQYKKSLQLIEKAYSERKDYMEAQMYIGEALLSGPELLFFASQCIEFAEALASKDLVKIQNLADKLKTRGAKFYKDYNPETDKKVMIAMLEYAYKNMKREYLPDFFFTVEKKYKGDFTKYVEQMFAKSVFANEDRFYAFLQKPSFKVLQGDLAFISGISCRFKYLDVWDLIEKDISDLHKGERLFVDGILQMNKDKNIAPDANSTIRLTYGNVLKYDPRDAVTYHYYTTLKGVMEKEDPTNTEFIVPAKLKELYNKKDFGNYVNENGEIVACFISNNDITGGNSGSPVINGEGHLIGLAFDGNSEAMSGDIDFEENLQRCINFDVRYMLFIIDKYAGAKNLIEEMTIVR
ncbi:MAG: S46 family peptidase [Bacteroidales bacterium]|jgi:hypothetical protein|nr:S46 family peptidase [Bacteroidales bacterium]